MDVRAMVKLQKTSLNPADVVVNTLHFQVRDNFVSTDLAAITNQLSVFYQSLDAFLSPLMSQTGNTVTYYNYADPEPREPLDTQALGALVITETRALPEELALVMSFQASRQSGIPQARRRGRIYMGAWGLAAIGSTTAGNRPVSGLRTALAAAGQELLDQSQATADWDWLVRSTTPTETFAVVDNGWVDDAFDTQRRRGVEASTRTTFS